MKIGSDIVGVELKEFKTRVNWRQTTNYAASVGDVNPYYFDDLHQDIIAPPMFAVCISWPVLKDLHSYLHMPYPKEIFNTMVHSLESIEFYRSIMPGEEVTINGKVVSVMPCRLGAELILKLIFTDSKDNIICIEYTGAALRGVECGDSGRNIENIQLGKKEFSGEPTWESEIHISKEAPYIYDGCSDIVFPIHTSPAFARSVGLPGIILQGTATMAHAAKEIVNREAGGNPVCLQTIAGRFSDMIYPGTTIKVQLMERQAEGSSNNLYYRVLNGEGGTAIARGLARVKH